MGDFCSKRKPVDIQNADRWNAVRACIEAKQSFEEGPGDSEESDACAADASDELRRREELHRREALRRR